MSMHQGLDLSRFKKIHCDGTTTTLRHDRGHEIRIARRGVTPKMRRDLDALPLAKGGKVRRYAEGDQVEGADASPEDAMPEGEGADASPEDAMPAGEGGAEPGAGAADVSDVAPGQPGAAVVAPAPPDASPQGTTTNAPAAPAPIQLATQLKQENQFYNNDLAQGHIKPETYHDLFAKKDTLGKIGTLFGLLISGAGSGLAHQPNAVADMMTREIDRDLDAQKASAVNAQNFLRLNQQHQLQQAQIQQMGVQNQLTAAQTGAIPSEIALRKSQARGLNVDADTKAYTLAKMQMNSTALHDLVVKAQSLPVGSPERAQADQVLAILSQSVQTENFSLADRAGAAGALSGFISGGQGQVPNGGAPIQTDPEAAFKQSQTMLRVGGHKDLADELERKHMPGIPGQASVPLSDSDRAQIQGGQALVGSLERLKAFAQKHGNSVDPKVINEGRALAAQVQGDFRLATHGGVFKEGEQHFIEGVVPSDPTKFVPSIRVLPQLSAVIKETGARTDQFLKSKGFAGLPKASTTQQKTAETVVKKGVKYQRVDGGWRKVAGKVGAK